MRKLGLSRVHLFIITECMQKISIPLTVHPSKYYKMMLWLYMTEYTVSNESTVKLVLTQLKTMHYLFFNFNTHMHRVKSIINALSYHFLFLSHPLIL